MHYNYKEIKELIGKTITEITGLSKNSDEIIFKCSDGKNYMMYHEQDCCEDVRIEDVYGDVDDLLNSPIIKAEERSYEGYGKEEYTESSTWTFYTFATAKGYVDIRWYGESNGYYSESVTFAEIIGKLKN